VVPESGQASVEWVGLVLLVALALGALASFAPRVDGRSLGVLIAARVTGHRERAPTPAARPPARALRVPAGGGRRVAGLGGGIGALLKDGLRKGIALNGLVCFLRKSTARNDTNRIPDDVGDAINCVNPLNGWTGDVGGTDDD
jgi:hypothetical protein